MPGLLTAMVALVLSLGAPAAAQQPGCDARGQRIDICSRLINSGAVQGVALSTLYFFRGIAYSRARRHGTAIADYSSAITLNPLWFAPYHNRGADYRAVGKPREAIKDFTVAITLAPKVIDAYVARGVVYHFDLKQPRRALPDYNRALKLNPKSGIALINRARAYEALKMKRAAIRDYRRVLKLYPKADEARTRLQALGAKP